MLAAIPVDISQGIIKHYLQTPQNTYNRIISFSVQNSKMYISQKLDINVRGLDGVILTSRRINLVLCRYDIVQQLH